MAMSGGDGSDGGINRNWVVVVVVGSDGRVGKTKVVAVVAAQQKCGHVGHVMKQYNRGGSIGCKTI